MAAFAGLDPSTPTDLIEDDGVTATLVDCAKSPNVVAASKRAFDFVGAISIIIFMMPLLVILVLLLFLLQGRPVLIKHSRIGREGRAFACLKFRTMIRDADQALAALLANDPSARAEWEARHKLKNDPRITPIGAVLRKTSVDEFPQLFNVVRGEMSLVGPRPIVQDEIRFYGKVIEDYCRVRPGLTGLWQTSGRSDTSYATRVRLDQEYVKQQSLMGDLLILVKTIPVVLKMRGSC